MNKIDELTHEVSQLSGQLEHMHKELIILRRNVEELQGQQVGGNNHLVIGAKDAEIK